MELREVLSGVPCEINGDPDLEVEGLAYDSRRAGPGVLFFCVPGARADGHDFAADAVRAGSPALVVERPLGLGVTEARVADARGAMAPAAARFFGDPTSELALAGITGTNGKTTTAFLLRHLLESSGVQAGLLGTVKSVVGGVEAEVERTTPEAVDLQATFRAMLDAGDRACAMEVSSHALRLRRTDGIGFQVAAFTNLTQDHLDFHSDMEDYFASKRLLFAPPQGAQRPGRAVVNIDDAYGQRLAAELGEVYGDALLTYSAAGDPQASLRAEGVSFDSGGSRFRLAGLAGGARVKMPLPGDFNVANALAALGCAFALDVEPRASAEALASAGQVPGRMEPVAAGQPFAVLVDYAHTPDSLENVLSSARRLTDRRLICVFGCGGDRDREKRPLMGEIAARLADVAVLTSDNPRSEDPSSILDDVLTGIAPGDRERVLVDADRRAAIRLALERARAGDTVVIAGKGHEQGQEFEGGRKLPFDDRRVAREELQGLASVSERT